VGQRAGVDAAEKRKISLNFSYRESDVGRAVRSLISILTEVPRCSSQHYKYTF